MDLPPQPRPWDIDATALVKVLAEQDGHAVIAFKAPASLRAAAARGLRAAIPSWTIQQGLDLLRDAGAEVFYVYRSFGAAYVKIDPALALALRSNPLVDYIEPRQWSTPSGVHADAAGVTTMLSQTTPWGISDVRAPEGWSVSTGSGVKVLIVDTGVNPHEDLPAIPGANCGGQFDGCADPPISHGTHVAGILLARQNTIGVVGVAHGVSGAGVFTWGACEPDECSNPQVAAGIDAGKFARVRVINLSLSGSFDQGIANAVASAWETDSIVLVAAAGSGQGNQLRWPAALTNVIGVAGVRPDFSFAATSPCGIGSNWGAHVDLVAAFWALSTSGTNEYLSEAQGFCGNSFSTPHVAGVAALLWAQNPTWTNQQIVDRLFESAHDLGATGRDDFFGHGHVDAANALGLGPWRLSVSISGPTQVADAELCRYEAIASNGVPPYTAYQWYHDGVPVSTARWYEANTGTSDFHLWVDVTDSQGTIRSNDLWVTVVIGGTPTCDA